MKKIVKISAAVVSSVLLVGMAHAATPGAYAGIGLGYSQLNTPNMKTNFPAKVSNDRGGLGGRVFGGYNFNKYFGLEAAYATYASSQDKISTLYVSPTASSSVKWNESALSLVGKAYLPINDTGFNLYALGGAAEVFSSVKTNSNGITIPGYGTNGTTKTRSLRPTYGLGASYDVSSHITTNLEYSRIQGKGNVSTSSHAIASANLVTLNLGYNFG